MTTPALGRRPETSG
ncbi:hypothetical protein NPIL_91201, partial [Nephila pilipes]